jgi:hypothetical protein
MDRLEQGNMEDTVNIHHYWEVKLVCIFANFLDD